MAVATGADVTLGIGVADTGSPLGETLGVVLGVGVADLVGAVVATTDADGSTAALVSDVAGVAIGCWATSRVPEMTPAIAPPARVAANRATAATGKSQRLRSRIVCCWRMRCWSASANARFTGAERSRRS